VSRALASWTTRPFVRRWPTHHPMTHVTPGAGRPIGQGQLRVAVGWVPQPSNGRPYAGMDPSDPSTYIRPWNPQPGMIGFLNFDGAARQSSTDMGGVWGNPVSQLTPAGARPRRRPR
jgi:hypothetical protein